MTPTQIHGTCPKEDEATKHFSGILYIQARGNLKFLRHSVGLASLAQLYLAILIRMGKLPPKDSMKDHSQSCYGCGKKLSMIESNKKLVDTSTINTYSWKISRFKSGAI